jgi:biotin carboxyl carrier protein
MQRRFRITVDGRPYVVTVEELGDAGAASASAGAARVAPAAPGPAAAPPAHPPAAGPGDVVATLSGVVEAVLVRVGDAVAAGARVVTIEAMKTKTPIVAHRAGRVARVHVAVGDPIETGRTLVTLE